MAVGALRLAVALLSGWLLAVGALSGAPARVSARRTLLALQPARKPLLATAGWTADGRSCQRAEVVARASVVAAGTLTISRNALVAYLALAAACGSAVTAVVGTFLAKRKREQARKRAAAKASKTVSSWSDRAAEFGKRAMSDSSSWSDAASAFGKRAMTDAQSLSEWISPKADMLALNTRRASGELVSDVLSSLILAAVICEAAQVWGFICCCTTATYHAIMQILFLSGCSSVLQCLSAGFSASARQNPHPSYPLLI